MTLELTPEVLEELRSFAHRQVPGSPFRHRFSGDCPWCRDDDPSVGYKGEHAHLFLKGGAHEWAAVLLDEIARLRAKIDEHESGPDEDAIAEAMGWEYKP